MPRRKSKSPATPGRIALLALLALAAFLGGEGWVLMHSPSGQLTVARYLPWLDTSRRALLVGRELRKALEVAGIPPDSIAIGEPEPGLARIRMRAGLKADASLMQANYAVTRSLAGSGIDVVAGHERFGRHGEPEVVLEIGMAGRTTHELTLARVPFAADLEPGESSARISVVVFGFADDLAAARPFFALPVPFAVAIPPGDKDSPGLFRDARGADREVVLHLPLEPINYPQVNPGPGTILVSMKSAQITGLVRRYLEQAGPVTAVANHLGSLATQDMTVMSAVYRELHRQRVPFLHMTPAAGAVCRPLASELGVSYEEPDAVLDYETRARPAALDKRWKQLLALARARGQLVVMVRATPLTRTWLPRALDVKRLKGISLVPLSSVLHRPAI
jgi:polysaccharide deacetylase 2 family uncharacterized protein YibQ